MSSRGFAFMVALTVLTVVLAGLLAQRFVDPGFGRTLVVGLITAAVVFPAGYWGEKRGWIKGRFEWGKPPADEPARPAGVNGGAGEKQ